MTNPSCIHKLRCAFHRAAARHVRRSLEAGAGPEIEGRGSGIKQLVSDGYDALINQAGQRRSPKKQYCDACLEAKTPQGGQWIHAAGHRQMGG